MLFLSRFIGTIIHTMLLLFDLGVFLDICFLNNKTYRRASLPGHILIFLHTLGQFLGVFSVALHQYNHHFPHINNIH